MRFYVIVFNRGSINDFLMHQDGTDPGNTGPRCYSILFSDCIGRGFLDKKIE